MVYQVGGQNWLKGFLANNWLDLDNTRGVRLSRYIRLSRYHKTYRDKDDRFINLDNSKLL